MRVHMGNEFQYTNDVQGRTSSFQLPLQRHSKLTSARGVADTRASPRTWFTTAKNRTAI